MIIQYLQCNCKALQNSSWHTSCNIQCIINDNQGLNMKPQFYDKVIYVLGFISIVVIWLTA
jgi:hypothetical protein